MGPIKITQTKVVNKSRIHWIKIGSLLIGVFIVTVLGYFSYTSWHNSRQILPTTIKRQLLFPVFWPDKNEPVTISKKTLKYDSTDSILSYIARTTDGNNIIVTEQATPESITASPQVYNQLIQDINNYEEFDSRNGTVYLTHPKELNGGQTAVMDSQGTLMFVKPNKDLSDNAWRQLFNNMRIIN